MSRISYWTAEADRDRCAWLDDVREDLRRCAGGRQLVIRLTLPGGSVRDYAVPVIPWEGDRERDFLLEYLCAHVFNILSVLGGEELTFCVPQDCGGLRDLVNQLPRMFQLSGRSRSGLGRVVSIAERMNRVLGARPLRFSMADLSDPAPLPSSRPAVPSRSLPDSLRLAVQRSCTGVRCGVDIGGTDIKLSLCAEGKLVLTREYDWNPSAFPTAEAYTAPVERLIREALEAGAGGRKLDSLGIGFPDVVVRSRITGGETPKTLGMRRHAADYEAEFGKLTDLADRLQPFCRPGVSVQIANDGHIAAVTAAAELAWSGRGEALEQGVIAHTLGTDLGTGWLLPDGTLPEGPMELYDLLLDLGSRRGREYPPEDLRSTRNENSGLPDTRRCLAQSAAWRLAALRNPALLEGFVKQEGDILSVSLDPDLRKPCLQHIMRCAEEGEESAESIFRDMGAALGKVCRELDFLCAPETRVRYLYGRIVQNPSCLALIREGCAGTASDITLESADSCPASTPLMRELAARPGVSEAQFAQSVGCIHFAALREDGG